MISEDMRDIGLFTRMARGNMEMCRLRIVTAVASLEHVPGDVVDLGRYGGSDSADMIQGEET